MFAAFVLCATLAAAADVAAQQNAGAKAPTVDAVKQADVHFRKGNQLYADKKWPEAEAAFLAAWALNPTYDVAANLGHTQYRLGKHRDAAEHLDFALRNWPLIGKPEPRKLAEERLAELRTLVSTLKVEIQVEHADVFVDGKLVGQSPLAHDLFVTPGRHEVEARHDLHGKETVAVDAAKGAVQPVRFTMGTSVSPPPTATPSATAVPDAPGGPRTPVLVAGGATAGAALVVGVVLTIVANGKASDAATKNKALVDQQGARACAQPTASGCQELHDLLVSRSTMGSAAAWSFIGAGTVGVATLMYGLLAPRHSAKTGLEISPVVSGREGGIIVRGAW
ncbi:MAG: hypothetical protein QM820_29700 [Minicystis sp.]